MVDPKRVAVEYYFGDLQYWKIPGIAANALEEGYDGPSLRRLSALATLSVADLRAEDVQASEIDSAFREMGVDAPISKRAAQMILATECAAKALDGRSTVFDAATHTRVHLCDQSEPPDSLRRIVQLSKETKNTPRGEWSRLEADLKTAFVDFWVHREASRRLAALGGSDPTATAVPRRRFE